MTRIRISVAACGLFLFAAPDPAQARQVSRLKPIVLPDGATMHLAQRGAATTVTYQMHGRAHRFVLPDEDGIYALSLADVRLLGTVGSTVAVITADYNSNPSGGRFQCGAGTETMIRVVALSPQPHQTFARRVASCWGTIDAGDISWSPIDHTLTIERTTYDATVKGTAAAQDVRTIYSVAPDGNVTTRHVERLP